jgi:protease IV
VKKVFFVILGLFFLLAVISIILVVLQKSMPMGDRIALIRIEGLITDSKEATEDIKEYVKNPSIKAIVLRIDSPGGAVGPAQEIYEEVRKAAAKKKVIVSMGSVAASGGYYIAAPATKIIANPGTLTGSIGVIMEIPNISGLMDKLGIKTEVVKSGRHKDIASIFRGIGKEEREILQGVLDNVHSQFIKAVAEGRNMLPSDVEKIADGRVFTGEQALKEGLIDELGDLEDAVQAAAKLSGIKGEPTIVSKKERFSLIDLIREGVPKELTNITPTVKLKFLYTP